MSLLSRNTRLPHGALWPGAIVLVTLFGLVLANAARSQAFQEQPGQPAQAQIRALLQQVTDLKASLVNFKRFRNNIICGRMDSELLKDNAHTYLDGCTFISGLTLEFGGPKLKATLVRPGVFKFEFSTPQPREATISTTALKNWGKIPVEAPILRVADVSQSGFTVLAFDSADDTNPTNVGFYFMVLLGEPQSQ